MGKLWNLIRGNSADKSGGKAESSGVNSKGVDSGKADSRKGDSRKVDSGKIDSSAQESKNADSGKIDFGIAESAKAESKSVDSSQNRLDIPNAAKSQNQASDKNHKQTSDKNQRQTPNQTPNQTQKSGEKEHEKKVILFDLDGTLLDSFEGIYEGFVRACEGDFTPTREQIFPLVGLPLLDMFSHLGYSKEEAPHRITRYKNYYRRICLEKTALMPGALEAVVMAKGFAHLGVVTTKMGAFSKQILQSLNILKYFQIIIGSEDVAHPKPHAEPILKALDSMPITPKDKVYMIGDTIYDLKAAKNAGVNGVWVKNGFGKELEGYGEYEFDNVLEAVEYIRHL
ncbi:MULTISPECIES: HAD family hydrolase [unclassified Helicobacter]|uniref:HAD family hydrolase n=1 Tax=unclassified Helicobacter TaxID=2593540 RepID=UPI000A60DB9F|nr:MULTISPECIES: HAD-IA family hydrolase [unclassified Helicobacter]